MSRDNTRSAFDRLRQYYDHAELVCRECGYEDDDGSWTGETNGGEVHYYHECPSCGAVREHTISLTES